MNARYLYLSSLTSLSLSFWFAFNSVFWSVHLCLKETIGFRETTACFTEVNDVLLMMKLDKTFLKLLSIVFSDLGLGEEATVVS